MQSRSYRLLHLSRKVSPQKRKLSHVARAKQAWRGRLVIAEEVEHALHTGAPIVALESTIITHGMPHPTNLTTALSLESIIRSHSAVPATIALLAGKVHVGLSQAQLAQLADPVTSKEAVKVSRRDLGATLAMEKMGGTTVAGTMYVGSSLGIKIFVTGGIGGVHRGAESSMDISADLIELGRTPMAVICAGAKSILDIPRTLEVLETQGVCVATYSDKPEFPAFYTSSSGIKSPWTVANPVDAAKLIHTSLNLPTPLSTLLAVPIPSEYANRGEEVQLAVEQAVRESFVQGIDKRGKEVTPWLLKRVGELTAGTALELNVRLIENNAHVGARVACEIAKLEHDQRDSHASSATYLPSIPPSLQSEKSQWQATVSAATERVLSAPSVLVFGSAAIDITSSSSLPLSPSSTTPGTIFVSPGGVGRNIAEAAQNLLPKHSVQLVSVVGHRPSSVAMDELDAFGKVLMTEMDQSGLRTDGIVISRDQNLSTAACSLTLGKDGDLVAGVADMGIVECMTAEMVDEAITRHRPKMVVFDCNLLPEVIGAILASSEQLKIHTFCDPTSVRKLPRLIPALIANTPRGPKAACPLTHLSPNMLELDLLYASLASTHPEIEELTWEYINSLNLLADWRAKLETFTSPAEREWIRQTGAVQKMVACLPFVSSIWLKASHRGLLHLHIAVTPPSGTMPNSILHRLPDSRGGYLILTYYAAHSLPADEIVSTTGAGDTLVGGLVAGLMNGGDELGWVEKALDRVGRTIQSRRAVG